MNALGSLLGSLGLNIDSSANEREAPVSSRAPASLPTTVPSGQGADLDAFKAVLASLGLSIGEPSSPSSRDTPAQAPKEDEPQQREPHRKRSVRFATDGQEPTRVSAPASAQKQHTGTPAPVGYTYAAPSSAQPDALRHQVQQSRAATAPTAVSAPATAESRRRDDAAAEAQQIMHAIRLSLDPANDVKPSDISAPAPTLPPAPSDSTERGRPVTREQMKEQATTTGTSPAVSAVPAHASASSSTPAAVRIPVRSPSPPTSKARSPMETIEVIEARFVNLEYEFVFPEHVDFAEPSSSPTPSLLYTPANAPIRQHESDLTSLMTQLDAVDSEGQGSVRAARKELVLRIEAALEKLDSAKAEAWTKQKPVAAAAKPEEPMPIADETHWEPLTSGVANDPTFEDPAVIDDREGSHVIVSAEIAPVVEVEVPAAPEQVSTSAPVEPSISVEAPASVAESISSYPPSLTSSSKSEIVPTLTADVEGDDTISTDSSPIHVPSDFEASESEAEEMPLEKGDDIPPSMEESARLERNTEFVML
ncbi:hypothetical protein BS47DRAFT_627462 [Hydnum rufescens UP504]|uniref:BAG domain-containing protein n=1 Tax=Hydnum rufescens UP504 TaxID=1448309 RepID=A0A9P6B2X4_9AGAM|nr:hypothetical protein BS47DRAFT_627462 [Hydnum rufescens UP504]